MWGCFPKVLRFVGRSTTAYEKTGKRFTERGHKKCEWMKEVVALWTSEAHRGARSLRWKKRKLNLLESFQCFFPPRCVLCFKRGSCASSYHFPVGNVMNWAQISASNTTFLHAACDGIYSSAYFIMTLAQSGRLAKARHKLIYSISRQTSHFSIFLHLIRNFHVSCCESLNPFLYRWVCWASRDLEYDSNLYER